jgi:putative transposase
LEDDGPSFLAGRQFTELYGHNRGYDGGKKVKSRKRHLLVDTEGFVLKAWVHSAKVMDYEGIKTLLITR